MKIHLKVDHNYYNSIKLLNAMKVWCGNLWKQK